MKLTESNNIQIGLLEDCAYLVPFNVLKKGILIADSIENLNQLSNKHSNIEFGDLLYFSDYSSGKRRKLFIWFLRTSNFIFGEGPKSIPLGVS